MNVVERHVGTLFVPLGEGIPHRPPGRELTPATTLAGYPGGSAIGAVSGGCGIASLETEVQAIQPLPCDAGLARPGTERLHARLALTACACPLRLSPPGQPLTYRSGRPS